MRSNGGVMTPEVATACPVAMMESGPVGGIIASARVGEKLGFGNVISFDMGGTTAKASLVRDGEPTLAPGYYVGGYASGHPVMLPMIDVVEVGAGGGSIAWIDDIGALKVGPHSAGADPGPICYRGGGTEPTITDANVVLGRLDPKNFLGGTMELDADGARKGVADKIAKPLSMDPLAAAQAILEIAVSKMSLAVREVSVEKGYDPRDFVLVASGGAGPLHVCAIARELHIPKVIVPLFPSHFSALGMLLADERHDFIRTFYSDLASLDFAALLAVHDEMAEEARRACATHATPRRRSRSTCAMSGRNSRCPCRSRATRSRKATGRRSARRFDALYEHRYSHKSPDEPVEMVNIRLAAIGKRQPLRFPRLARRATAKADAPPRRLSGRHPQAGALPDLSARRSRRRRAHQRAGADRGARHHDRAVRQRSLHCRAVRRADHRGRRRMMAKTRHHAKTRVAARPVVRSVRAKRAAKRRRANGRSTRSRSKSSAMRCRPSPTRWPPTCSAPPTT